MSLSMGYMLTSLVILRLDRGLADLGVSAEFENWENADQYADPQHRRRSGLPWNVW